LFLTQIFTMKSLSDFVWGGIRQIKSKFLKARSSELYGAGAFSFKRTNFIPS
jgi:hypothetical protein